MGRYIYTDGSYVRNGLKGETAIWGFVVTNEKHDVLEIATGKVYGEQNSNRAELSAFLKALNYVENNVGSFVIRTDFQALVMFCEDKITCKANKDLYKKINKSLLSVGDRVVIEKVKSHNNNGTIISYINGLVDKTVKTCATMFIA